MHEIPEFKKNMCKIVRNYEDRWREKWSWMCFFELFERCGCGGIVFKILRKLVVEKQRERKREKGICCFRGLSS